MRKILSILLLAFCVHNNPFAQNIDHQKFTVQYIKLPTKKFPDGIETYRAVVDKYTSRLGNVFGNNYEEEKITLNGYYPIDSAHADLLLKISVTKELAFDQIKMGFEKFTVYPIFGNKQPFDYYAYYYIITYYSPEVTCKLVTKNNARMEDIKSGGVLQTVKFGENNYDKAYLSEAALAQAWESQKKYFLAATEKKNYNESINVIRYQLKDYCLTPEVSGSFSVFYVDDKKKGNYADLRAAKDTFLQGINYIAHDNVALINKLVQPDYLKRKETIQKAIAIWEKALSEADLSNNKARIDTKVARQITYNLALAYLWIDDYKKAKEYLQTRTEDLNRKISIGNLNGDIKLLTAYITQQEEGYRFNSWRKLLTYNDQPYVYTSRTEPTVAKNTTSSPAHTKQGKTTTQTSLSGPGTQSSLTSVTNAANKEEGPANSEITFQNISYTQLQSVSAYLYKNWKVTHVSKSIEGKKGRISLRYEGPTDQLADFLIKCNCGVKMEIVRAGEKGIEVAVK